MKVDLIVVGKTDQAEVRSLVAAYLKRLNFYAKVTLTELPDLKNTRSLSAESQKRQEGEALLRQFGEATMSCCSTKKEPSCARSISRCGCKSG